MESQKYEWVIPTVILMVSGTLSLVVLSMVVTLLFALFHPGIDNKEIFAIFSPAFSTIIGGMLGILSGIRIGGKKKDDEEEVVITKPVIAKKVEPIHEEEFEFSEEDLKDLQ